MARIGTRALFLLTVFVGPALGWQECAMPLDDRWEPAAPRGVAERMLMDYERRYTCTFRPGALAAASYTFSSACTSKAFTTAETRSCLDGRRVMFLGDSMSTQQSDSLLGMLRWHPDFLTLGHPQNSKFKHLPGGKQGSTLLECWRHPYHSAGQSERCYDIIGSTVPRTGARRLDTQGTNANASWGSDETRQPSSPRGNLRPQHRALLEGGDVDVKKAALEVGGGEVPDKSDDEETSVHVRMFPAPKGAHCLFYLEPNRLSWVEKSWMHLINTSVRDRMLPPPEGGHWLERAVSDFNETRSSDVFVVNFGAHYHDTTEGDECFKAEMAPILQDMARLGETATVIWREIAPTHFPSTNASYDSFQSLPNSEKTGACCTGTPPAVLDRNVWVETYLRENGLEDRVKLLKIYRMSYFRGSAHHTCHEASPTTPDEGSPRDVICPAMREPTDCRHFSETGVIEAWNGLLLNHLCPA